MLFLLDSPDVDFNTFFNPHSIIVKLNAFSLSAQTAYSMVRKANLNKGDKVLRQIWWYFFFYSFI